MTPQTYRGAGGAVVRIDLDAMKEGHRESFQQQIDDGTLTLVVADEDF